jgi:hypothetical protein
MSRRTDEAVLDAVSHVAYELQQLVDAAVYLETFFRQPEPAPTIGVSVLESCMLHSRNMIEFFSENTKKRITAADFLGKPWQPSGDGLSEVREHFVASMKPKLNAHLSHLDWERVSAARATEEDLAKWQPRTIARDVLDLMAGLVVDMQAANRGHIAFRLIPNLKLGAARLAIGWPWQAIREPTPEEMSRAFTPDLRMARDA